jgi:hypothetical protein
MPMPLARARQVVADLGATDLANLYAQAEAQLVLFEVGETPDNFPPFAEGLDDRVTALAYLYLSAGCSLAEQGERLQGGAALERAARLLRSIHVAHVKTSRDSAYHVLLASMAAYAAGQYSWAFVMMQSANHVTAAARLVTLFLRRDRVGLQAVIGEVLLAPAVDPSDEVDDIETGFARAVARALAFATEFTYTGGTEYLRRAEEELEDALVIATEGMSPAWWWVARLLRVMLSDLGAASPWTVVPPYFGGAEGASNPVPAYVQMLACDEKPVLELWRSQREALPKALGQNQGAVVSLRTSGGKTRVAELAILQILAADPGAKVFYLAPFRSLAFELESTLGRTLRPLGYQVSHLYGGSRASRSDVELVEDARVIVATPEKARAIFRADPDLFLSVRLFVVDEGHLLGSSPRDVRNELYLEHLRVRAAGTGARFLLLSAVLPNADQIAGWIAGDSANVGTSAWRPSLERFGLLQWDGAKARIDWRGDQPSFNPQFVVATPTSARAKARLFPNKKTEAVAAAAVRLWAGERPVMIFVAQAQWVAGMAKSTLEALRLAGRVVPHDWPEHEWKVFEALCEEELPPGAIELIAARSGVICHSNNLPSQVRLAMEHLMRSRAPRIVIATSTLAQGVNIGVNTVIVSSAMQGQNQYLGSRDFWNIAGRAGRAFVDVEGKILYAIDRTKPGPGGREARRAERYFLGTQRDPVASGVLQIIGFLKRLSLELGMSFDQLVEMAAEDEFAKLGARAGQAGQLCDLLDDALLALQEDTVVNGLSEPPEAWIERTFRESLAVLQARAFGARAEAGPDEVIAFVRARAQAAFRRVPTPEQRRAVVSSSLPLTVALRLYEAREFWQELLSDYVGTNQIGALVELVKRVEQWFRANGAQLAADMPVDEVLDRVREGWLSGVPLRTLCEADRDAHEACRDFYGFTLTWVLHAVSQQFRAVGDEGAADLYSQISLCVERGLPSEYACLIFLAGVQSRGAAVEISMVSTPLGDSISTVSGALRDGNTVAVLRAILSPMAAAWLDLLRARSGSARDRVPKFSPFTLPSTPDISETLFVRTAGGTTHLSSVDGRVSLAIASNETWPFESIANDARFCFRFFEGAWRLVVRDPRLWRT